MAKCGVCDEAIVVKFKNTSGNPAPDLISAATFFPSSTIQIVDIWPSSNEKIPDRLPDNVKSFFIQALNNKKTGHWDAAGAMFRKSLDVATKVLAPEFSGTSLFNRINKLAETGKLTTDLSTWAHEVRIDGNESVHGDEPETEDDVSAIHEFCEAILLYSFTLPGLVADRTSKKLQRNSA